MGEVDETERWRARLRLGGPPKLPLEQWQRLEKLTAKERAHNPPAPRGDGDDAA